MECSGRALDLQRHAASHQTALRQVHTCSRRDTRSSSRYIPESACIATRQAMPTAGIGGCGGGGGGGGQVHTWAAAGAASCGKPCPSDPGGTMWKQLGSNRYLSARCRQPSNEASATPPEVVHITLVTGDVSSHSWVEAGPARAAATRRLAWPLNKYACRRPQRRMPALVSAKSDGRACGEGTRWCQA